MKKKILTLITICLILVCFSINVFSANEVSQNEIIDGETNSEATNKTLFEQKTEVDNIVIMSITIGIIVLLQPSFLLTIVL